VDLFGELLFSGDHLELRRRDAGKAQPALCANINETSCVTAISEQGGKETLSMATMNGSARSASQEAAISDSVVGSVPAAGGGAPRPDPEVLARPKRRTFTAEYKQQVLAEAEAARGAGEIGAVLRRHGLYSSHLTKWRKERKTGILEGLAPQKRGPKSKTHPLTAENQKLRCENERLTDRLRKAEIVIDVQKKVAMLLGLPIAESEVR
jgi:transposase-like protein